MHVIRHIIYSGLFVIYYKCGMQLDRVLTNEPRKKFFLTCDQQETKHHVQQPSAQDLHSLLLSRKPQHHVS